MVSMAKKEDRTRLILENHGLTRLTRDFQHLTIDEPPSRERDEFRLSPQPIRGRWTEAVLRETLEGLKHGSECEEPRCKANLCSTVKAVFRHGINCQKRVEGGCFMCKLMWHNLKILLQRSHLLCTVLQVLEAAGFRFTGRGCFQFLIEHEEGESGRVTMAS